MPPFSDTAAYVSQDQQDGAERREHWPQEREKERKEKIKVTRANNKKQNKIKLNGEDLEDVERVSYPDSDRTVTFGAEEDVKS